MYGWWLVIKVNPVRYTLFIACKWANYFNHHFRFYESCFSAHKNLSHEKSVVHLLRRCLDADISKRITVWKCQCMVINDTNDRNRQMKSLNHTYSIIVSQITSFFRFISLSLENVTTKKTSKSKLSIMNGLNMSLVCSSVCTLSTNYFQWPYKR